VCAELRNRGVQDVLIACVDGLTGFPEAIEATFPQTVVQTCVVHLIRAAMRFISYNDRMVVAAALRPIYTAATEAAAAQELDIFEGSNWGKKYPATVRVWRDAWAGSPDVLPHRGPLRTGRASCPRIRLKQAHWGRGMVRSGRCAVRPCGRSRCGPGVKREDRSSVRVAGRR
jgi:hypothetical protein